MKCWQSTPYLFGLMCTCKTSIPHDLQIPQIMPNTPISPRPISSFILISFMHMICTLYGFPFEMDFYHPESLATKVWFWDSGEKSISQGKPYKMHFLAYFTIQGMLVMLNTLHKVEDHENHVRWIYITTVLYTGGNQKYARRSHPRTCNSFCKFPLHIFWFNYLVAKL